MERGVGHKEPGCEGLCRYVSDRGSAPPPLHSLLIKEKKMTRPEWAVIKKMNWLDRQTGSQIMRMTRPERGGHT